MSSVEITADLYTRSLSDAIRRGFGGMKDFCHRVGVNHGTAKNIWEERNGLNGVNLIRAMRESDEVLMTVLELAGRADIVERAKAHEALDEAWKALSKLKGGGE